jgi:hypothetical protein
MDAWLTRSVYTGTPEAFGQGCDERGGESTPYAQRLFSKVSIRGLRLISSIHWQEMCGKKCEAGGNVMDDVETVRQ